MDEQFGTSRQGGELYSKSNQTAELIEKSKKLKAKKAADSEKVSGGNTWKQLAKGAAGAMQDGSSGGGGGGNAVGTTGDILLGAGLAAEKMNPYMLAGGAALKVLGGIKAKREQAAKDKANLENDRRANLQSALARLGSGVGSLGMA